jgi:hypothetical protein
LSNADKSLTSRVAREVNFSACEFRITGTANNKHK